jgi:hypothetical protein
MGRKSPDGGSQEGQEKGITKEQRQKKRSRVSPGKQAGLIKPRVVEQKRKRTDAGHDKVRYGRIRHHATVDEQRNRHENGGELEPQ